MNDGGGGREIDRTEDSFLVTSSFHFRATRSYVVLRIRTRDTTIDLRAVLGETEEMKISYVNALFSLFA